MALMSLLTLLPSFRHSRESGNPGPQDPSLALDSRFRANDDKERVGSVARASQHRGLDDVDAALAVDKVAEATIVDGDIVGGGKRRSLRRIGLVEGDLAGREGIGDVEDAQALGEPGEGNDAALEAL